MWGSIIQVILAAPQIIRAIRDIIDFIEKWNQQKREKEASDAVDETVRTGDQRREEAAFGGVGGAPSVGAPPGLQTRPRPKG